MRSEIVIFRGPSISEEEAKQCLKDAIFLPPAKQGDMYRAYLKYRPKVMGLIDGNFERIPSPWHKEILFLMSQGVKVFGASSMGALRASELDMFGMYGIGEIYLLYSNGIIEDDDEVAIVHAPKELDYKPLSDAMVDIRFTLSKAVEEAVISNSLKQKLEKYYKSLFYKNRLYQSGIDFFKNENNPEIEKLESWLINNKVEQKKQDAITLIKNIFVHEDLSQLNFSFSNTVYWHNLKFMIDKEFMNNVTEKNINEDKILNMAL